MNNDRDVYYRSMIANLEEAAKNNRFQTKEELNKYIEGLKKNGMPENILNEDKKKELLDLYDKYHTVEKAGLDMQNYKGVELNEQNYIVSKESNTILKTDKTNNELPKEFQDTQNELAAANGTDSLANADVVYDNLRKNIKEEVTMISLYEVANRNDISQELLSKVKFFITNKYINPYSYKFSPETGIFYNVETDEMLEVVKNTNTGKYEIIKGGEVVYKEGAPTAEVTSDTVPDNDDNQELERDTEEEIMPYEKSQPKVRRLVPPKDNHNQAAFAKGAFLVVTCILVSMVLAMIILLIK